MSAGVKRGRVLVTGASAGLGTEFARQLAARGLDLLLVARREDRLRTLAAELGQAHAVDVDCFAADLSDPAAPAAIEAHVREREYPVDWLINNAGAAGPALREDTDWSTLHRISPSLFGSFFGYFANYFICPNKIWQYT